MTTTQPGYGDLPATQDELGFAPSATALTEIVLGAELADTPLTVGVYGPWGSGKTSLMKMIYRNLNDPEKPQPGVLPIWFDAWRYVQSDALWRALLISVVEEIRVRVVRNEDRLRTLVGRRAAGQVPPQDLRDERASLEKRLDDLAASLYRSVDREDQGAIEFQWGKAGKLAVGTVIRAGFSYIPVLGKISEAVAKAKEGLGEQAYADTLLDLFQRERTLIYRDQVQSLEQFYAGLKELIEEWAEQAGYRLVIFIDDLDRCLPEQAIGVLEAIKVFLDIQGCIFVLGVDREIIERGIRVRYKEFALAGAAAGVFPVAERDYLEKIVQIPFALPPLALHTMSAFLRSRLPGVPGLTASDADHVATLMAVGLLRNPRKVKRSFNIFRLHLSLDRAHGRQTAAGLIAKLTVIQTSFADLYERIARDPTLLKGIEVIARGTPTRDPIDPKLRDDVGSQDPRLKEMLYLEPFFEKLDDNTLRELVYQSRVTGEAATDGGGTSS